VTVAFTGSVSIAGPTTISTIPPSGTAPGTHIVATPPVFTTVTSIVSGLAGVVPISTVVPSGPGPVTVIIGVPAVTVTVTAAYSGSDVITVPTTVTVTQSGTAPGSVVIQTPIPTFSCNVSGYLIQKTQLYGVDITSGQASLIRSDVGDGRNINSMGYNVADNYLYATIQNSTGTANLIRIAADGGFTILQALPSTVAYNTGDVDEQSQLWASNGGQTWIKVDLLPGSPTYGQVVDTGTTVLTPFNIADWAYIPGGGDYLWGLASDPTLTITFLVRFDRTAKSWQTLTTFGNIAGTQTWGAVYASADGYLYASENASGEIWRFPLPGNGSPVQISNGPPSSSNDGARCIDSVNPI